MAVVRPFKGIRPRPEIAHRVISSPHFMSREDAKEMAKDNEYSFLHIGRAEINLDDSIDSCDELVYKTARRNLDNMIKNGVFVQDQKPMLYIYRQIMDGRVQTGIVGCTSIDDYLNDIIKKHELTRPEKVVDRFNNFDYCDANTEPIFLTYRKNENLNNIINEWIKFNKPVYNFTSEDDITHVVWVVDDNIIIDKIHSIFQEIDYLYIADGHHRSASSVKVGLKRREEKPNYYGDEEFNFFLSVIFPDEDLFVIDYNRVVKDLNGHTLESFIEKVMEKFEIEEYKGKGQYRPIEKHTFGMYLENKWYKLKAKPGTFNENDPVDRLDVSILQNNLLGPILGIGNPRTDKRIDFVGGRKGLEELERRVAIDMKIAFSMYPTTMDELLSVADAGKIMPPKSTCFEPKLSNGLFIHRLFD